MFRTITHPDRDSWIVLADWHGAQRIVFEGTIFACVQWTRDNA